MEQRRATATVGAVRWRGTRKGDSEMRIKSTPTIEGQRLTFFWSQVEKTETCWLWRGRIHKNGYGAMWVGDSRHYAHRLSFALHRGGVPEGAVVCHSCDVRNCVRPDHLWAGTQSDNLRDAVAKERGATGDRAPSRRFPALYRGERNAAAKLTTEAVRDIRQRRAAKTATLETLAAEYGVGIAQISRVAHGLRWQHVADPAGPPA